MDTENLDEDASIAFQHNVPSKIEIFVCYSTKSMDGVLFNTCNVKVKVVDSDYKSHMREHLVDFGVDNNFEILSLTWNIGGISIDICPQLIYALKKYVY